jgi:hypothetical protein
MDATATSRGVDQVVMAFWEIENLMPFGEPAEDISDFVGGLNLYYFEHHLRKIVEVEDSKVPYNDIIDLVLRELYIGLEYIPKSAICMQKYYMMQPRGLYMVLNTSVKQFVDRFNDLNRYLLYFPEENPKQLDQDEIIQISDQSKAI